MKPRVMYLDIDDTLLVWGAQPMGDGQAAPFAADFVHWAMEHFEVRWLTLWCPVGTLLEYRARDLSNRFDFRVSTEEFMAIKNPRSFMDGDHLYKTNGIDFEDPRPWVWVEDEIIPYETSLLEEKGLYDNYYPCNVSKDPTELFRVWRLLALTFDLPFPEVKND